jgi:hypothetical protein
MICSVCEQPCDEFRQVEGVCIACIEDCDALLQDEIICSDLDFFESNPEPEQLGQDQPTDR